MIKSQFPSTPVHYRLLNHDGTFNIQRKGMSKAISRDLYHTLLSVTWWRFLLLSSWVYLAINCIFALAYSLCGRSALEGASNESGLAHLVDAFFFSVQTFATIGYGKITPVGVPANLLVTLEALVGLLGVALSTGLLFARFSRPTARVIFSRIATISNHEGQLSLVFRMANARLNQIVEARVSVSLAKAEVTVEGERYRNFYDLALERTLSPIFALSWTVVHPIDDKSPLKNMSQQDLIDAEAEIFVSLTGIDDTFSQTIHTRYSYTPDEVLWDRYYEDMLSRTPAQKILMDLGRIHDVKS